MKHIFKIDIDVLSYLPLNCQYVTVLFAVYIQNWFNFLRNIIVWLKGMESAVSFSWELITFRSYVCVRLLPSRRFSPLFIKNGKVNKSQSCRKG